MEMPLMKEIHHVLDQVLNEEDVKPLDYRNACSEIYCIMARALAQSGEPCPECGGALDDEGMCACAISTLRRIPILDDPEIHRALGAISDCECPLCEERNP